MGSVRTQASGCTCNMLAVYRSDACSVLPCMSTHSVKEADLHGLFLSLHSPVLGPMGPKRLRVCCSAQVSH